MLKRDRKWEIFYGDISLAEFTKRMPLPIFRTAVNKEVVNSFGIVYQLLVHSYYQYLFVDVAVARALHVFEMALWIRYKEINNGTEWDLKKRPLSKLIDWFNEKSYFEIANKDFLNHVRNTRNHLSHPKGFHFAGAVGLPWINTVVDLINGLYEDIELRRQRWKGTAENKAKLDLFLAKGAKLTFLDTVHYIYDSGPLKIENRLELHKCFFSLLPLFDVNNTTPKTPLVLSCPSKDLNFKSSTELSFGNKITLSNDLTKKELDMISEFRIKVENEEEYVVQNAMLKFEAGNRVNEALRESLTHNIMLEQEFIVDIKINASLMTNRKDLGKPSFLK